LTIDNLCEGGADNPSVLHPDNPVRHLGEALIVGDDNEGLAELLAEVEEELVELLFVLRVEGAGGLVGKDDIGLVHEGAGHGDALLLATRELGGAV